MNHSRSFSRPILGLIMILLAASLSGCPRDPAADVAQATCEALSEERFEDALALSSEASGVRGAGREVAECRCLAFLSLGDRASCTQLLSPLLAAPAAADWIPHSVLSKLIVRTWQGEGRIEEATRLARRVAPMHRNDLDLLQLELLLRSAQEDEIEVLREIEARLEADPSWIAQRLVLALAWQRRAAYADVIRVLGPTAPPIDHPLVMPWYESRIRAQAASGDLSGVQESFARWAESGWDATDLAARYALRLSVEQLIDPAHDTVDLLRESIADQARLRDPQLVWGLHRRLIAELLGAGRPEQALEAYDAARQVVRLEGITREEIERAVRLARGQVVRDEPGRLRFEFPEELLGGTLSVSPPPHEPPDAGYSDHPIAASGALELQAPSGLHPRRWILRDANGRLRASGAVWPEAGHVTSITPQPTPVRPAPPPAPDARETVNTRPAADGRRQVFAILADCADWRLTEYLRARGELPFHDRMFGEGYRSILESRPAFTAAALQSLVWPAAPSHPSSLGWVHHLGLELAGLESVGRNPVEFLSWVLPERPNLFEAIGAGPLVAANMLLAHGRIEAGRHAELIGPHSTRRSLPSADAYRPLSASERERFPALMQDPDTRRFAEAIAAEMDAAEEIARAGEVDFLFLRLEALDLMTHAHFAPLDGRGQDDGRGPLLDAYRYIDARLAVLYAQLDQDDWLVYMSDHGIRSSMQHEEDAIFVVIGAGVPAGRAPGQPALRGVPHSLAAMLDFDTTWPDTGAMPWLRATPAPETPSTSDANIAAHR